MKQTPYSHSLVKVLSELRDWGFAHREKIKKSMRKEPGEALYKHISEV